MDENDDDYKSVVQQLAEARAAYERSDRGKNVFPDLPRDLFVQFRCKHCGAEQEATLFERPTTLRAWGIRPFYSRALLGVTVKSISGNRISRTSQELSWVCYRCTTENVSLFPWIAEDQEPPPMAATG